MSTSTQWEKKEEAIKKRRVRNKIWSWLKMMNFDWRNFKDCFYKILNEVYQSKLSLRGVDYFSNQVKNIIFFKG